MLGFLLGCAFALCLSLIAAGLLIVAHHRGWIGPWWHGF